MTKDELLAAVPIHMRNGRAYLIAIQDIPEPWRLQFENALNGSVCPVSPILGRCAFAWDWVAWVNGNWAGRVGPMDLT